MFDGQSAHPQLPMDFSDDTLPSFELFWPGRNQLIVDTLISLCNNSSEHVQMCISGPEGAGKTHLLSAACLLASRHGGRVAYLTGAQLSDLTALQGLEDFDLVCIDDLQELPDTRAVAIELFAFLNRLRSTDGRLLVATNEPVARLEFAIADVKTRLQWGASFALQPVAAEELFAALKFRVDYQNLQVADDVLAYLLRHQERAMDSQVKILELLRKRSIQFKRPITIPFVRETLL